ncbi:hypothetical protein BaRGS_00033486 [Batillaria attramentaria]|uniref:Ig-like domain-containing protein n=1 Tax=Batillaria attramentaria TaxID=370345 RepID=A0ABD0JKP5_9CAEN
MAFTRIKILMFSLLRSSFRLGFGCICLAAWTVSLPVSARPQLSLSTSTDVTFTCNMAHFQSTPDMVIAIQFLRRFEEETAEDRKVRVLATAGKNKAWASLYMKDIHQIFQVDGKVKRRRRQESRARLTIADITWRDYGKYLCHVLYITNAGDSATKVWKSEEIALIPETLTLPVVEKTGFSMRVTKALCIRCEYSSTESVAARQYTIVWQQKVDGENVTLLPAKNETRCPARGPCTLLQATASYTAVHAHLFNLTCEDAGEIHCGFINKNGQHNLPQPQVVLNECEPSTKETAKECAASTILSTLSTKELIVVCAVVLVIVVGSVICITVFVFRKRRKGK